MLSWRVELYARTNESKKKGKDQESIQSSTTPGPRYQWESANFTIRHHKQKLRRHVGLPVRLLVIPKSSKHIEERLIKPFWHFIAHEVIRISP